MADPTPIAITHDDLAWLLRNLTIEIVTACSPPDDPLSLPKTPSVRILRRAMKSANDQPRWLGS